MCSTIHAQDPHIDSLINVLLRVQKDSAKVDLLNELSALTIRTNPTEAIDYAQQASDLANKINDLNGFALALKNLGLGNYFLGDYAEASFQWEKSLEIYERIQDLNMAANLMTNLGAVYSTLGNDARAIDSFLKSLKIAEEQKDSLRIATALLNIGATYAIRPVNKDRTLNYYWQALDLSEKIAYNDGIGLASFNLGELYYQHKEYDSALFYLKKSLNEFESTIDAIASLNYVGKIHAERGNYSLAMQYQEDALKMSKQFDAQLEMAQAYLGLADTYQKQAKLNTAIDYFHKSIDIAREMDSYPDLKEAYQGLSIAYMERSDFKNAFKYQSLLNEITETIFNIETDDRIKNLQFTFQLDKKEDEIAILEQESEIEQLNSKRQKLVINVSLAGLGFVIIIAIIILRNYLNKVKINKILDKQKLEIENLLLNILPKETARELQKDGYATPRYYDSVSVLFTDFAGFTTIAEGLKPHELIAELNSFFNAFDEITEKFKLEKIKTIGDAYMCAGGVPTSDPTHPVRTVQAGLALQEFMVIKNQQRVKSGKRPWGLRVGIHTGPIVAGVVGSKKYAYDIWGDTVNIASRMESKSEVGKVNISAPTYELINGNFECLHRGKIAAKNKGNIDMYFVMHEKNRTEA